MALAGLETTHAHLDQRDGRFDGAGITVPKRLLPAFAEVDGGRNVYAVVCRPEVQEKLDPHHERVLFLAEDRDRLSFRSRLMSEQLEVPLRALAFRADVILSPFNLAVAAAPVPQVLMFQNVAPYTRSVLAQYGGRVGVRLRVLRELGVLSAKRAQRVVFVANAQRETILPHLGISEAKTSVVYTGWDQAFTPDAKTLAPALLERLGVRRPYLLSVSQFYRYKNFVELVKGFALACKHLPAELQLVLAGAEPEPDYSREVRAAIADSGIADRVVILGQVPYEDLPPLYAAAEQFLFPSMCESFPNILLEGLASGVPVLSSNQCSMPEIAGEAAVYFDAREPALIADRIVEVWRNRQLRDRLVTEGVAQARRYSWNQTATALLEVMETASR